MAEKIENGIYQVGETQDRYDNPQDVIVAKGSAINDSISFGLRNMMGVKKSKWYVVVVTELLVQERGVTTGSYCRSSANMKYEKNSKKQAVKKAEQLI